MTPPPEIEKRVRDFIADFYEAHSAILSDYNPFGFVEGVECPADYITSMQKPPLSSEDELDEMMRATDGWSAAVAKLAGKHCTRPDVLTMLSSGFGLPCEHDPEAEHICSINQSGARYVVESRLESSVRRWYEYTLEKVKGCWKISKLEQFFSDAKEADTLASSVDVLRFETEFHAAFDTGIDFNRMFRPGERVQTEIHTGKIEVKRLQAKLHLQSGQLIVADSGFGLLNPPAPFNFKIEPGEYSIEIASLSEGARRSTNVGAWLLINNEAAAAYVPCQTTNGEGSDFEPFHVGVDTGAVIFADFEWLTGQSKRDRERICSKLTEGRDDSGVTYPLDSRRVNVVAIRSGHGDGGYPCYWGVNQDGIPVNFVIDFRVCGRQIEQSRSVRFTPDLIGAEIQDPALIEFGFNIRVEESGADLLVIATGGDLGSFGVSALDRRGKVLADSEEAGLSVAGDEHTFYLHNVAGDGDIRTLAFKWVSWRHLFTME